MLEPKIATLIIPRRNSSPSEGLQGSEWGRKCVRWVWRWKLDGEKLLISELSWRGRGKELSLGSPPTLTKPHLPNVT